MKRFNDLPQPEAFAATVAEIFSDRIAHKAAPAIRFCLFDVSGTVQEGGFGDAGAAGNPPGPGARFRIASCTKSFTAAAMLVLRDRGRLALDEPVTRYVPALIPTLPAGRPEAPTLRMLLSMAGGFPTDDPWADRQEQLTGAAFDAVLRQGVRFATVPGTRFEYSNLGYALLGRVIEEVSGKPYPAFVTETLLAPLGLDETGFDPALVPAGRMATGFRSAPSGWQALPFSGPGAFSAIGGLVTTTGDLARWANWLCAAFRQEEKESGPLSAASRREMQRIQCVITPGPGEDLRLRGYGYGLNVEHDARYGVIVSHSGGYPGFSAHMRWHPQTGLGVLAFENASYSGAWMPVTAALERLLEAAFREQAPLPEPPVAIRDLAAGLCRLVTDGWNDTLADTIFLENVALDRPYAERAAELAALCEKAGAPSLENMKILPADPGGADNGYGRFELHLPAPAGTIVAKALCGPPQPARIQSVTWQL